MSTACQIMQERKTPMSFSYEAFYLVYTPSGCSAYLPLLFLGRLAGRGFLYFGGSRFGAMRGKLVGRFSGQRRLSPILFWNCLACRRGAAAGDSASVIARSRSRNLWRRRSRGAGCNWGACSERSTL